MRVQESGRLANRLGRQRSRSLTPAPQNAQDRRALGTPRSPSASLRLGIRDGRSLWDAATQRANL